MLILYSLITPFKRFICISHLILSLVVIKSYVDSCYFTITLVWWFPPAVWGGMAERQNEKSDLESQFSTSAYVFGKLELWVLAHYPVVPKRAWLEVRRCFHFSVFLLSHFSPCCPCSKTYYNGKLGWAAVDKDMPPPPSKPYLRTVI